MLNNKLYIHIKGIENGFILKDLTDQKDGEEPKTYVATNLADLRKQISDLIELRLKKNDVSINSKKDIIYQEPPF